MAQLLYSQQLTVYDPICMRAEMSQAAELLSSQLSKAHHSLPSNRVAD